MDVNQNNCETITSRIDESVLFMNKKTMEQKKNNVILNLNLLFLYNIYE